MRFLIDTHVLIWWMLDDEALPKKVRDALLAAKNEVYVSSASAWEIATKYRLGKMPQAEALVKNFMGLLDQQRFEALPVSMGHAIDAGLMKARHADPFDRMLAAQARRENMQLVTGDRMLRNLVPTVFWQ